MPTHINLSAQTVLQTPPAIRRCFSMESIRFQVLCAHLHGFPFRFTAINHLSRTRDLRNETGSAQMNSGNRSWGSIAAPATHSTVPQKAISSQDDVILLHSALP